MFIDDFLDVRLVGLTAVLLILLGAELLKGV